LVISFRILIFEISNKRSMKKLVIGYDQYCESPRTFSDHYTKIFSGHRSVKGDVQANGEYNSLHAEYLARCGKDNIELPIYLYEHSGIALNTTGFNCRWDSGQLGYIFVSKSDIRKEFGWKKLTHERIERIKTYMRNEVEVLGQWLNGEVYYYRVVDEDGETIDALSYLFNKEDIIENLVSAEVFTQEEVVGIVDDAFDNLEY
jgi:hypothetical protein